VVGLTAAFKPMAAHRGVYIPSPVTAKVVHPHLAAAS
jgi:hypothetical protein